MPGTPERVELEAQDHLFNQFDQDFSATGSTDPIRFGPGEVVVQLSGTGTVTAIVERSTRAPSAANWAPADYDPISGDLDVGVAAERYAEPVRAWWRVSITARTGTVKVNLMGPAA